MIKLLNTGIGNNENQNKSLNTSLNKSVFVPKKINIVGKTEKKESGERKFTIRTSGNRLRIEECSERTKNSSDYNNLLDRNKMVFKKVLSQLNSH